MDAPNATRFVPYKGWEGYEQSKYLKPWSPSLREKVKFKTGIDFPEGTKGFPIEIFYFLLKGHEWFLNDFFDTTVSNNILIAAKNCLKTCFLTYSHIFLLVNFDNVHTMAMTKYQNALDQAYKNLKGYLDMIENLTGLSFHSCFDLPEELDVKKFDIKIERVWKEEKIILKPKKLTKKQKDYLKEIGEKAPMVETTETKEVFRRFIYFRSFDHANKIANFPKQPVGVFIALVQIIEPVMMNDTNEVSSEEIENIWLVNKSSIFRYAYEANKYAQMFADMNNWDSSNIFVKIAETALPWDKNKFGENGTYSIVNVEINYRIRRLNRYSNTLLKLEGAEKQEHDAIENSNEELWLTMYWGAPYKDMTDYSYPYLSSLKNPKIGKFPDIDELDEIVKNHVKFHGIFEPFYMFYGIDFGTNHATSMKVSLYVPETNTIYRKHIYRNCNMENKKSKMPTVKMDDMMADSIDHMLEHMLPYVQNGFLKGMQVVYGDGGSRALCELYDTMIANTADGMNEFIICEGSQIFGSSNRKEKLDFQNYVHSKGCVVYDEDNIITIEQFQKTKSKKSDPEVRDENNQLLDEIDATDIAEDEIRNIFYMREWISLKEFGKLV